jgi:2-hydroxychromene-2-carboxylate isomerase
MTAHDGAKECVHDSAGEGVAGSGGGKGKVIEFYFDFISPFGYCASLRIDDLAARYGRRAVWSSMLVGVSVMKVMKLPPIRDLPLKGAYQRHELERYARRHGIVLGHDVNTKPAYPIPAGRAFHWLNRYDPDLAEPAARAILRSYWLDNRDIGNPELVADICGGVGADRKGVLRGITEDDGSILLRSAVERSLSKGVFGSPFFIVDGEPFFGVDKMELIEEWLKTGGW